MLRIERLTPQFKVSVRGGRWKYFASLEAAKLYAEVIWQRTGDIVAIERAK